MSKRNWARAHNETRGRQQDREAREAAGARKRQRHPPSTKMSPRCPLCGSSMIRRKDAAGRFWGCFKFRFLSRICGVILVPGGVPSCDKGQFP